MHCWARDLFIVVVAALATGQMITACGQKGDLYIPEPTETRPAEPRDGAVPEVRTGESPGVEEGVSGAEPIGKGAGQ
jgi:predicted small lipoprotein YifL